MKPANENTPKASLGECPICGKPAVTEYKPFCSKRCADVDLQRWFTGRYAIPTPEGESDGEENGQEN
ncbi:DNA gyrase inhibitor YacG [Microvirga flavescens]|uniref:DNA gyrase inhibitor YacG n=1 Tax=Microvirga flavescens TaxID=2249811 RepID=UPI000DD4EF52|nr:DNA gyrase inhibitor YacG [Microvirga flavescens]